MRNFVFVLLIPVLLFAYPFQGNTFAQDNKCSECHTSILDGKIKHSPINQGCAGCHTSNGQAHPQADVAGFTLTKEMPDLCYTCHTPLNTKSKIHGVVKNGKCMICHTIHSSNNPSLLKDSPTGKICLECHDDLGIDEFKAKHKPVVDSNCTACHDPHQSEDPKLLKLSGQDLCYSCHTQIKAGMSQKSVHPPAANKCSICHSPHGSNESKILKQNVTELCFGCHDNLQEEFDKSPFPHKALKE